MTGFAVVALDCNQQALAVGEPVAEGQNSSGVSDDKTRIRDSYVKLVSSSGVKIYHP
jgi:hypothetical protein